MDESEKSKRINAYLENAKQNGLPKDAYLQIIHSCNAKCVMCTIWKKPLVGNYKTLIAIIDSLKNLNFEWITLWGGEPLLHPNIVNLMKYVKDVGLQLQVITNGAYLKKYAPDIALYVDNLVVSLDSGIASIHNSVRGIDIFDDAVNGIKEIQKISSSTPIEIDCTVLNENSTTLKSIILLSKELNSLFVDFDPAQIVGVGNNSSYILVVSEKEIDDMMLLAKQQGVMITSEEKILLIKKYIKKEPIIMPCYSYCKDLLISPNGNVFTCWTISDIIGNILDTNFSSKWFAALKKNKEVLLGNKKNCFNCGFSHSRMPDDKYARVVINANKLRYEQL
ncbi:MAG: radical SAM protein [Candidatus Woesearchaeota archaeon]